MRGGTRHSPEVSDQLGLHLVYGTLDGRAADASSRTPRFWWAATTMALADRLGERVQQEARVSQALVSLLHLDGKSGDEVESPSCVHVAERTSAPVLVPMGISFDDTKLDPSDRRALTPGIETALSRESGKSHQVPRCGRRHSRGVKCMRCSTCERMSRPRSHRPSSYSDRRSGFV